MVNGHAADLARATANLAWALAGAPMLTPYRFRKSEPFETDRLAAG